MARWEKSRLCGCGECRWDKDAVCSKANSPEAKWLWVSTSTPAVDIEDILDEVLESSEDPISEVTGNDVNVEFLKSTDDEEDTPKVTVED